MVEEEKEEEKVEEEVEEEKRKKKLEEAEEGEKKQLTCLSIAIQISHHWYRTEWGRTEDHVHLWLGHVTDTSIASNSALTFFPFYWGTSCWNNAPW